MRRTAMAFAVLVITTGVLGSCGGDDEPEAAAPDESTTTTTAAMTGSTEAKPIAIAAQEYAFEVADSVEGGLVKLVFNNRGKEAHFAGLAKVAEGKTFNDVKAALTAPPSDTPPSGPPPFEEFAGAATVDPGGNGSATFNLPAGSYAWFCALPAPDGLPHASKGMIKPLTVTEGIAAGMPTTAATMTATDFSLAGSPPAKAGSTVVGLRNQGKQLHEVNLVELAAGKKMEDVVAWFKAPAGPPPMMFRSGVAVKPGEDGATEFELQAGPTYAFLCAVPDALGDFAPHIVKGMYTATFTVS